MNERLDALLTGSIQPGVYRCRSRASVAVLAWQAGCRSWRTFHLDGRQIASKAGFLAACAGAMHFPAYFGHNWDALEDSLRDLAWAPAERGYLVLYDGAGRFAEAAPEDFTVALDILEGTVEYWRGTATPMVVLLRGLGRATVKVPEL